MRATTPLFTLLFLTLAGSAQADPHDGYVDQTDASGQKVVFKDDLAVGAGLTEHTALIPVRPGGARVGLLRPRTHFIPEMLKTVENL